MPRIVLISTYELGHQPFAIASVAAWLERVGASVTCCDLAVERLNEEEVGRADLIVFHLPMHTATRIALAAIAKVRQLGPKAILCAYGLYALPNAARLRVEGVSIILGTEAEEELATLVSKAAEQGSAPIVETTPSRRLPRLQFIVPDRKGLPPLPTYAKLCLPNGLQRVCGYTEASRGCKHLCRHCPIVPIYNGQFRVVQREVVLEDIRRQVAAGAEHITFGDPDFFNGPTHGLQIVRQMHQEFPDLSYDVTIKVEHLLKYRQHLQLLHETGCSFVVTAVESVDDAVLDKLDKGHTRRDFIEVVGLCRDASLPLHPTFVAFTPWISLAGYRELLATIAGLGLIDAVAPIQLAIRLLFPAGSRLLEVDEVRELIGPFDEDRLCYQWTHSDPRVDELQRQIESFVAAASPATPRVDVFRELWSRAHLAEGLSARPIPEPIAEPMPPAPRLTEPWYCCAEPTTQQMSPL